MVKIKGHEIGSIIVKGADNRRAMQFKNNIITALRKIGVNESDINIPLERMALKKARASVTWYQSGHRMYYSHNRQSKYVENLHVILKIIEIEANLVFSEINTLSEFISKFEENSDVDDKRKKARELFGCEPDEADFGMVHKKYRVMAKELHPDMPTGDTEKFKALNVAHKILKRELT